MLKKFNTPVLLIAFNRPDLTGRVLARISDIRPTKLYIAVDGPRNDLDRLKVNEVKRVLNTVNWPCEVKRLFHDRNLGCKFAPVRAMDWFFKNEEMGIILEDDVLADRSFFYFARELLNKYKNSKQIGSISGNNFQFGRKWGTGSYYFSRYSHSCGWATWKRAWKLFDADIRDYDEKKVMVLNEVFSKWTDKMYWKLIFRGIQTGENNAAWDYQWNWMMWKNHLLGIIPNSNLINNIGYHRADASHTKTGSRFADIPVVPMDLPLIHPGKIRREIKADDFTQNNNYILWKELGMSLIRKWNGKRS